MKHNSIHHELTNAQIIKLRILLDKQEQPDVYQFARMRLTSPSNDSYGAFGSPDGYTATINAEGKRLCRYVYHNDSEESVLFNQSDLAFRVARNKKCSENDLYELISRAKVLIN